MLDGWSRGAFTANQRHVTARARRDRGATLGHVVAAKMKFTRIVGANYATLTV